MMAIMSQGQPYFDFRGFARVSALVSGIMNSDQLMNSRNGDGVNNSPHRSRKSNVKGANIEVIDADTTNDEEDDEADSPVYLNTTKPSVAPAKRKQKKSVLEMEPPFALPINETCSSALLKSKFRPIAHPSAIMVIPVLEH